MIYDLVTLSKRDLLPTRRISTTHIIELAPKINIYIYIHQYKTLFCFSIHYFFVGLRERLDENLELKVQFAFRIFFLLSKKG